ncbi:MAG: arsenic transporter [Bryobacteraceae bacterium]
MNHVAIWLIAALTITGILLRPRGWSEAVWTCLGATLLLLLRLLPVEQALSAVRKGTDVYLFLAGMMLLAELARREELFDWLASHAVLTAKGSQTRLFTLVYAVGILVTTFLSNDATAVVLTPAVYAAVKKAGGAVLPYLLICAFIANAASFVLPISNPANLVIFGRQMPPLLDWFRSFALPSLISIAVTYLVLLLRSRSQLKDSIKVQPEFPSLPPSGRTVAFGIVATAITLLAASAARKDLGLPTFIAAIAVLIIIAVSNRSLANTFQVLRCVSWEVLPMVAGLFVIVQALDRAGAVEQLRNMLRYVESWTPATAAFAASFGVAFACNVANNLPVGLLTGSAIQGMYLNHAIRDALVIGIDLGPNLSVTGSLATLLWLVALRREGQNVTAWKFLKIGLLVAPPALLLAAFASLLSA